jgi:hypothetical protein
MGYKPTCLVCQKEMVKGFIPDVSSGRISLLRWCEGEPDGSIWTGDVSRSKAAEGSNVITYRCPECKALRLYAPDTE